MQRSPRILVLTLLTAVALTAIGCSEKETVSPPTIKPGSASTTATSTPTSSPGTSQDAVQPEQAIYPFATTGATYPDPVPLARAFAVEYLGMPNPVVGEFQQGDSRSGEIEIRSRANGPTTTVLVRQLEGDNWWVIGAATATIQIESPTALATVSSPVTVSGQSTAFEGTINLEIREDGRLEPIAEGFTNGGSMGEMGPFSTSLNLGETSASGGAIIVKTISPEDGNVDEASVLRVRFS